MPLNPPATLSQSVGSHSDTCRNTRDVAVCDRVFRLWGCMHQHVCKLRPGARCVGLQELLCIIVHEVWKDPDC